ncbi:hypothetical protein KR084_003316, partial [Drosophila pseudotakahashii]
PTSTKHPLWKAHPNLSAPSETVIPIRDSSGSWARSDKDRACTFALHLRNVFQPNPATNSFALPSPPLRIETETDPIQFQPNEVAKVISEQLKPKKAPGGDLITAKMLIELPNCAVEVICKLFNGITRLGYFPKKWKKSVIIMIPKPGKDHTIPASYRPISLLSGSVLGPVLYTIFTSDLPRGRNVLTATYADDTAFLATSALRREATDMVQDMLNEFEAWASRWNIAVNSAKSQHATFS